LGSNYGKRGHVWQSGNLGPLIKLLDGRNNVVESYTWCKGMVKQSVFYFIEILEDWRRAKHVKQQCNKE
jgi:hypothetical protein